MEKMSQKRNRAVNWDEAEKQLLRTVLKEYSQIIENKNLDSNTNKNKSKAWEELHKKFNELNSRPRDLSQLKIQWKAMKIHARKVCSTYKKEINKTGGGARPTTPENYLMEIKDLLNPAELLRDHNIYDSDGTMIGDTNNVSNQELDNIYIQAIEDADTQVDFKELSPLVISENDRTMETPKTDSIGINSANNVPKRKIIFNNVVGNSSKLRKISEDEITVVTPKTKSIGMNPAKNISEEEIIVVTPKTKCIGMNPTKNIAESSIFIKNANDFDRMCPEQILKAVKTILNNVVGNGSKPKKDREEYVSCMLSHSKLLKDEEHMRHMEMAEEEHKIKMEILKEKLNAAILEKEINQEKFKASLLEREILELKKGLLKGAVSGTFRNSIVGVVSCIENKIKSDMQKTKPTVLIWEEMNTDLGKG